MQNALALFLLLLISQIIYNASHEEQPYPDLHCNYDWSVALRSFKVHFQLIPAKA